MAKVSLAKLFDRVNEIDKTSQVAVMQSEDSLQISEKNRVDLERLIATLRVDGDFQTDTVKPDDTLQQSFANLTSSVEILRQDVDQLYQAFYLSQQGRQSILQQEDRALFKQEDTLQKNIGKQSERGGLSKAMKRDPNQRQQDLEREVGKKRKAILKGLGLGLLSSFGMALGTSVIGGGDAGAADTPPAMNLPNIKDDQSFKDSVSSTAKRLGIKESDLYAVMGFETGGTFDPAQKNKAGSGATGLIQFMPETAKGLGTTTDELAKMTRTEQMKYVEKYLSNKGIEGKGLSDLYMSILFPAAVGKSDDYVLFGKGAMPDYRGIAYDRNKGLDLNNDGSITKAEASSKVIQYKQEIFKTDPTGPQSNLSPSSSSNFRPVVDSQGLSLQPPLTANNITSINLPPQTIDGGTSGGQQRGQARAEGPPSVHSTTNPAMFGNVITNRFLSVVV